MAVLLDRRNSSKRVVAPTVRAALSKSIQPRAAEHLIVVENVHKSWLDRDTEEVRGLRGASFTIQPGEFVFLTGRTGEGKAQPLNAQLLTPTGWIRMGDVRVGQKLISADGAPTRVTGVFPQGRKDIYRVDFSDGTSAECTEDHLWAVRTKGDKFEGRPWKVRSLTQIIAANRRSDNPYYVPVAAATQFLEQEDRQLPLDPYLLGALLGDGNFSSGSPIISSADEEILEQVRKLVPKPLTLKHIPSQKRVSYDWRITHRPGVANPLTQALRELDLMGKRAHEKQVPVRYLFASQSARLAMLQGLCDTDGYAHRASRVEFVSCSRQLAEDVAHLARSLGGTARVSSLQKTYRYKGELRTGRPSWKVLFRLPSTKHAFRLSRKKNHHLAYPRAHEAETKAIVNVQRVRSDLAQCISVDHPSSLYVTDQFIVTHNTTTLRLLLREFTPDQGRIWLGNVDISSKRLDRRSYLRRIGYVPQNLDLIPDRTAQENISMRLEFLHWPQDQIRARTDELLRAFRIEAARNKFCDQDTLSGGERQRVAIARALAHKPDMLLCDEPTGQLDIETSYEVMRTLNQVSMLGTTVICATHDHRPVDLMRKRVITLANGEVAHDEVGKYRLR